MKKLCQFFLGLTALGFAIQPVMAGFYVYQLPDGSRVVTDQPRYEKKYKLIRSSAEVENLGRLAASGYQINTKIKDFRFEALIQQMAARYEVDVGLVKAIIRAESFFNPNATSRVGASGLMQLMPATARQYGVTDLYSPPQNIEAGVRHLKYLLKRYPDNLSHVVAAYNAGEDAVDRYQGIPPYRETRNYVKKVLKFYASYSGN
jgi:soluble lytic murein transglycosylase-like protein